MKFVPVGSVGGQVGDIGRMVDEFSGFARMPAPAFKRLDMRDTLREAAFLVEVSRPDIKFERQISDAPLFGNFDSRMLGQAFGNIIKNAAEAIEARLADDSKAEGHLLVRAALEGTQIIVDIVDNGKGLPRENRHRLLEPYMTTREKGTGLGLAIVKKIVEDHHGTLTLRDADENFHGGRGALIRMTFPVAALESENASAAPAGRSGGTIKEKAREMSKELNHGI